MLGRLALASRSGAQPHIPAAASFALAVAGGGLLLGAHEHEQQQQQQQQGGRAAHACGIVGVVGKRGGTGGDGLAAAAASPGGAHDARAFLLEGLTVLQNRGYDSAGLATLDPATGQARVTKYASRGDSADSIKLLREKSGEHRGHHVGIAHTRWATHGGKTDENAHPHTDAFGRVALVHNGTINNANALRKELQAHGVTFTSETDTEVIAQLIGWLLEQSVADPALRGTGRGRPTISVKDATAAALLRCDGTWGIAVMSASSQQQQQQQQPDSLVLACNGSPMTIGLGQGKVFVASEPAAFNRHTKNFIAMQDGEIGVVAADGTSLDLSRIEVAPNLNIEASPAPHRHWTIKECLEQPSAIARALGFGGRLSEDRIYLGGLDRSRDKMASIRHLILAGCGTSLNASLYGAKLMREYDAFETVAAMDAAEIREHDFPRKGGVRTRGGGGVLKL
jgi:glucosamine--fructose-6-phosphate aminotransferase (isomerizing)